MPTPNCLVAASRSWRRLPLMPAIAFLAILQPTGGLAESRRSAFERPVADEAVQTAASPSLKAPDAPPAAKPSDAAAPALPDVRFDGAPIDLGELLVGQPIDALLVLQNDRRATIRLGGADIVGAGRGKAEIRRDSCSRTVVAARSPCDLVIQYTPSQPGPFSITVSVPLGALVNGTFRPRQFIKAELRGVAVGSGGLPRSAPPPAVASLPAPPGGILASLPPPPGAPHPGTETGSSGGVSTGPAVPRATGVREDIRLVAIGSTYARLRVEGSEVTVTPGGTVDLPSGSWSAEILETPAGRRLRLTGPGPERLLSLRSGIDPK